MADPKIAAVAGLRSETIPTEVYDLAFPIPSQFEGAVFDWPYLIGDDPDVFWPGPIVYMGPEKSVGLDLGRKYNVSQLRLWCSKFPGAGSTVWDDLNEGLLLYWSRDKYVWTLTETFVPPPEIVFRGAGFFGCYLDITITEQLKSRYFQLVYRTNDLISVDGQPITEPQIMEAFGTPAKSGSVIIIE